MFWPIQQPGSTGETVRTVQYLLNVQGANLIVDGVFGPLTASAVSTFQSAHGLVADGVDGTVNWYTWHALVMDYLTAHDVQSASNSLFQAWANNDQSTAANYATGDALAALFVRAYHASVGWTFDLCEGAAGHFICTWKRPGGSLAFKGNNKRERRSARSRAPVSSRNVA